MVTPAENEEDEREEEEVNPGQYNYFLHKAGAIEQILLKEKKNICSDSWLEQSVYLLPMNVNLSIRFIIF